MSALLIVAAALALELAADGLHIPARPRAYRKRRAYFDIEKSAR